MIFKTMLYRGARFRRTLLVPAILGLGLAACSDDDTAGTPEPAYVRVFDIQHGETYTSTATSFSVFEWDGSFYGNPALDSVTEPKFTIPNVGDFILGRAMKYMASNFSEELAMYRGGIDYYNNQAKPVLNEYDPDREFFYRSGLASAKGIYFPNLTHRVQTAPIIGGIDYYKWAAFPSGAHTAGFRRITAVRPEGGAYYSFHYDSLYLASDQYFAPGGVYSLVLCNRDRAATQYNMVTIRENPHQTFDPKKAYVRFVNAIEETPDGVSNVRTETVDIYRCQIGNDQATKLVWRDADLLLLEGRSEEKLVAAGLRRFQVNGELPYIEMDFTDYFDKNDTTFLAQSVTPTYIYLVYAAGESAARGDKPFTQFSQVLSNVRNFARETVACEHSIEPLIRNGARYDPTIVTVFIGGDGMYYNLEQASMRQAYLDTKKTD